MVKPMRKINHTIASDKIDYCFFDDSSNAFFRYMVRHSTEWMGIRVSFVEAERIIVKMRIIRQRYMVPLND